MKTFIINKIRYNLIDKIKKVLVYSELTQVEQKIADKLIDNKLLLKVDLKRAKELGFEK